MVIDASTDRKHAHAATFTEITQHFASVTYDAVHFLTPPSL